VIHILPDSAHARFQANRYRLSCACVALTGRTRRQLSDVRGSLRLHV